MKTAGRVITVILAVLAFAGGAGLTAVALDVTQPSVKGATAVVQFEVNAGDSTGAVAARLQKDGLIRNAELFKLLARYRHLDTSLEPGVYKLSPSMTMDQIIHALLVGKPDEQLVTIPPGLRVTQYPKYITSLPNFKPDDFLKIAQTGLLPDGTKLSDKYWYVEPKGPNVAYALEGYLFPDTYYFASGDNATAVVERLLNALGEQLCPGPDDAHLDAYITDKTACKAHATTIKVNGKDTNIFDAMESQFSTKNDATAIYDTLILASLVEREARSQAAMAGVASVYYNRFLAAAGIKAGPDNGGPITMDADPTVQYATGTVTSPWPTLQASARTIAPDSPFNSYTHPGLPPSPICAMDGGVLQIVLTAPSTTYYYFITGADHQMHYAHTSAEQDQNIAKYGIG